MPVVASEIELWSVTVANSALTFIISHSKKAAKRHTSAVKYVEIFKPRNLLFIIISSIIIRRVTAGTKNNLAKEISKLLNGKISN